jgi:tetratricopeptide (TPR) repeat protein
MSAASKPSRRATSGRVDHESLGKSLHNVGVCLSSTSQYDAACRWYERAVEAKRKGDKFGHVDKKSLAESLRSLATCLRKLDRHPEADQHDQEANEMEQVS